MKYGKWLLTASLAAFFAGSAAAAGGYIDSLAALDGIKTGVTTAQQVRDLLGPPLNIMRFPARGVETLEYEGRGESGRQLIQISVGGDGVVREVLRRRPPTF
jgi:hypothetical protein